MSSKDDVGLFQILCYCAVKDFFTDEDYWSDYDNPRQIALEIIVKQYPNYPQTLKLLRNRIANDPDPEVRYFAREQLRKLNQK